MQANMAPVSPESQRRCRFDADRCPDRGSTVTESNPGAGRLLSELAGQPPDRRPRISR
jgi:hypothetical protein